ncbi:class E sortase [Brevibacterium sp. R8603A2]|uniref:class E sortase n=1 Tax=Brevibacterium sp. R8603A2 TaxID=2929779 RepID=UPI001FF9B420|nr:class E sortase [Brevibacterium sp. R8603A2]
MDEPLTRRERKAREAAARAQAEAGEAPAQPAAPASPRPMIRPAQRTSTGRGAGHPGGQSGYSPSGPVGGASSWGAPPSGTPRPTIAQPHVPQSGHPQSGGHHSGAPAPGAPAPDVRYSDPRSAVAAAFAEPIATRRDPHPADDGTGHLDEGPGERSRSARGSGEREPLGVVRGTVRTFGELCITAGLVLILFVVWQLWWTDIAANEDNANLADQLTSEWADNPRNELPPDPETPFVAEPVDMNSAFGIVYIPRFGEDYYRTMAEGVAMEPVLNRMGLGRYPNAAMPGEVGNFALAGHRVTYGKPLNLIAEMRPGDEIIVQTADGFYTYTFRNFDIVLPDATEVLAPVPDMPEFKGKDRIMTLTACNPMFSARERYIAYAELTDWQPAAEGVPESLADSPAFEKATGGEV